MGATLHRGYRVFDCTCVDCGNPFSAMAPNAKRCSPCWKDNQYRIAKKKYSLKKKATDVLRDR